MSHIDYFMDYEQPYLSGNAEADFVFFQQIVGDEVVTIRPKARNELQRIQGRLLRNIEANEKRIQAEWKALLNG